MYQLRFYMRVKRWIADRRGRMSELARRFYMPRQTLRFKIYHYGLSLLEMDRIKVHISNIEREEKRAIDLIRYMRKWMKKGKGRQVALAKRLGITPFALRLISQAKKDKRFSVLKYGIHHIRQTIKAIEKSFKHD